jgi:hypothetical protein
MLYAPLHQVLLPAPNLRAFLHHLLRWHEQQCWCFYNSVWCAIHRVDWLQDCVSLETEGWGLSVAA